jgi:hypothetical protein
MGNGRYCNPVQIQRPEVGTVFIASAVASRPGRSTYPPKMMSYGGRDEYGPYLRSLELNETRCRGAMMNFNILTPVS